MLQLKSNCLFIKGVKFAYLEVSTESYYWCDKFALSILLVLIFTQARLRLMQVLAYGPVSVCHKSVFCQNGRTN